MKKQTMKERVEGRKELEVTKKKIATKKKKQQFFVPLASIIDNELLDSIPHDYVEECFHKNRLGDALLYVAMHRTRMVFVSDWMRFIVWAGHHWKEDKFFEIYQNIEYVCLLYYAMRERLKDEAKNAEDKDEKAHKEVLVNSITRRLNTLCDSPGMENLLKMVCRVQNPPIILPDVLDKQHYLKACPNGVIDLRTGELRDGKPDDYLLKSITTKYDPALLELDDPCPEVSAFLLRSMDDDAEMASFIWRLLGYGMITERKDHVFSIFWGEYGRNGKDTLMKLITNVLGLELSTNVKVEMFLQTSQVKNSSAPSTDILELRGLCIAWINEAEENQRFAHAKLKELTGGSYIAARGNYDKEATKWVQTHLPIMMTNELPKAKADDAAFWERAIIVKWPLSFVEDPDTEKPYQRKADKHLDEKLANESQGVLVRLVQGAMEYLRDGLKVPEKVKEWTREQRSKWDDVGAFLQDWCEQEPHQDNPSMYAWKISTSELYNAFCIWYAKNRDKRYSVSVKKFSEGITKKNILKVRSNGTKWLGIRITKAGLEEMEQGNEE